MREVQWKHITHKVYEGELDFKQDHPDTPIKQSLRETEQDDWCWSSNGFIVQCIRKTTLTTHLNRHGNKLARPKATTVYYFPRVKLSVREHQLDKRPFYFPTNSVNISSENVEDYQLINRPKVRLFAEYIKNGLSPQQAYVNAFGILKNKQVSFLMGRRDIINYIMEGNKKFMKAELEQAGLNKAKLAETITKIVTNEKENAVIRKWALEFVAGVYDNATVENNQPEENSLLAASRLISN